MQQQTFNEIAKIAKTLGMSDDHAAVVAARALTSNLNHGSFAMAAHHAAMAEQNGKPLEKVFWRQVGYLILDVRPSVANSVDAAAY